MVNDELFRRRWLIIGLTFAIVGIFIARLFSLQIVSNDYKQRAENNAYYILTTIPARGVIFDRTGELLVANRPIYDLMIVNHEAKGKLDTTLLASTLGLPREEIVQKLEAVRDRRVNRGYNPYTPQVFLSQLEPEEVGRFEEQLYKFPGFSVHDPSVQLPSCCPSAGLPL